MEGENAMSLCDKCKHYDSCELGLIVHNPLDKKNTFAGACCELILDAYSNFKINKGDKIAQCTLMEHKGYLLGIESHAERSGGFGSSGK